MYQTHAAAACPARRPLSIRRALAAAFLATAAAGSAHASCGAAFCSLDSDFGAEAAGLAAGSSFDLRYEHITQDEPRAGSRRIAVGEIRHHHDEVRTRNRNLIATWRHSFASGWGVGVSAPLVDRRHFHIHNHHGAQLDEQWNFRELGDVRVTGRYQRPLSAAGEPQRTGALVFGLKLPTGKTDKANGEGAVAERSLQPGTGTTDLILGAVFHQQLASAGSWFAQVQAQRALNAHGDYRPGTQVSLDLGYAHPLTERLEGVIQLTAVYKPRDRGAQAEPADTGGKFVHLSPGLSYRLTEALRLHAFYQQPVYQYVNGVQLTAPRALVAGVTTRF